MGSTERHSSHNHQEASERWDRLARGKGYKCSLCSQTIPYGEQDVFFERGLCGFCAYMADRDDLRAAWSVPAPARGGGAAYPALTTQIGTNQNLAHIWHTFGCKKAARLSGHFS